MAEFISTGIGGLTRRPVARNGVAPSGSDTTARVARAPSAELNVIPASDVIENLVARALHALGQGRVWQRGAMVNLVV